VSSKKKARLEDVQQMSAAALRGSDHALFTHGGHEDPEEARASLKANIDQAVMAHGAGNLRGCAGALDDVDLTAMAKGSAKAPGAKEADVDEEQKELEKREGTTEAVGDESVRKKAGS